MRAHLAIPQNDYIWYVQMDLYEQPHVLKGHFSSATRLAALGRFYCMFSGFASL